MMAEGKASMKTTIFDSSLERYKVESFENTNAKRVPYEEIDYNIYEASRVDFSTTEARLPIWIKALYTRYCENGAITCYNTKIYTRWIEEENENYPSKCKKISLSFNTKENENVLTITVDVIAGRIKAQGRLYKEWGGKEFDLLLAMINSPQETWKVDNIKPFVEMILKKEKINPKLSHTTKQSKNASSEENTTPTTARDKTFTQIKLHLANIEADFVLHKENTEQTISALSQSIETKDKEIVALKKADKEKQQIISDLTLKLLQMEENITGLNKRCKKIEDKNSNLQQLVHKIQNESYIENRTWASTSPPPPNTNEEYNIPTTNTFNPLPDDATNQNQEEDTSKHEKNTENMENPQNGNAVDEQNDTPQEYPSHTAQPKLSTQPETSNDHHQNQVNAETIIICDSNGRYLKPKELCPDSSTKYIRSSTLSQAKQKIETLNFGNPKTFIIHCGTNDIEQPGKNTITETLEIVDLIKQKHPNCRILISSLLRRKDDLNDKVPTINSELKTQLSTKTNIMFIQHANISNTDLYDKKHLNQRGVKKFAKNVKAAYFNTTPKKKEISKKYISRSMLHQNFPQRAKIYQPSQFGHNHPNIPNPSFTPNMNLPPPNFNTQHTNKENVPPPLMNLPPLNTNPQHISKGNVPPPLMNLPPPHINPQHINKGNQPLLPSFCQDPRTNPLPPQLVGLIRQLYGCVNL